MILAACAAVVLLSGFYVLRPLFREPPGNLEVELLAETELDRLLGRKAVVYSNLKDLEFEYKMGRLGEDDYARLEAAYKVEAAQILRRLDALGAESDLDEKIEDEVAAKRARLFPAGARHDTSETCPACHAAVIPGKKFCADCGHQLKS